MAIPPSNKHWELFEDLYLHCPPPLHPKKFLERWDVSYTELAKLAGCSRSSIEHWFSKGDTHREPSLMHQRRLAVIDRLWRNANRMSQDLIHLWCNPD